jgi:hypothetical protein
MKPSPSRFHHTLVRLITVGVLLGAPVLVQAAAARGAEEKPLSPEAEREQRMALSGQFLVPESRIEQLRHRPMGWGEIFNALAIAQRVSRDSTTPLSTDEALTRVLELRSQNLGWGKIALHFGFKLGPVVSAARKQREQPAP